MTLKNQKADTLLSKQVAGKRTPVTTEAMHFDED